MSELFNLSSWLVDRHLEEGRGDRLAIRSRGRSLSYVELGAEVAAAGNALQQLGLRPEERVVLALRDSVELAAAFLGAVRVGAIPVLVNPMLPARDVAAIASLARARMLLTAEPETAPTLVEHAPELELIGAVGSDGGAADTALVRWEDVLDRDADVAAHASWEDSPAFWLFTSGTTGRPKLVMHRHLSARLTVETYATCVLRVGEDDRCYSAGPLFHAYGLGNALTFPLAVGASAVLDPRRPPGPPVIEEIMTSERPTLFFCIPTLFAALLASGLPADTFASVRLAVSAAEPLPAETWRAFRERLTLLGRVSEPAGAVMRTPEDNLTFPRVARKTLGLNR